MTFHIKKKYLLSLGQWLSNLSLNGRQSRARTRVISLIEDALSRLDKERKDIVSEYGVKNEDGSLKIVEDDKGNKNYDVPDEKKGAFDKDIAEMYDEDAELSGPEAGPAFLILKDIVLNYDKEISPEQAVMYDKWCEAFENFPTVEALG